MKSWKQKVALCVVSFLGLIQQVEAAPAFYGKLVFHRYSSYDAWDSQLYLYNFSTQKLQQLSGSWGIDHAMNANFSPDGKWLTFMGVNAGQHYGSAWDIYLWQVGSTNPPVNLTQGNNLRDEDPKFMPDGQRIVFKQNGDLKIIRLSDRAITSVTNNGWSSEKSMPYPLSGTNSLLYAKGADSTSRIYAIDQSGAYDNRLSNVTSYYPVDWGSGQFLYVRWYSGDNQHDQVYSYNVKTGKSVRLPFNSAYQDASDPAPLDNRYLVVSRTNCTDGMGGYDLYMVDSQSGNIWTLPINSSLEDLGADYTPY